MECNFIRIDLDCVTNIEEAIEVYDLNTMAIVTNICD